MIIEEQFEIFNKKSKQIFTDKKACELFMNLMGRGMSGSTIDTIATCMTVITSLSSHYDMSETDFEDVLDIMKKMFLEQNSEKEKISFLAELMKGDD